MSCRLHVFAVRHFPQRLALLLLLSIALLHAEEIKIAETIPLAPQKQSIAEGESLEYSLPIVKKSDGSWKKGHRVGLRIHAFAQNTAYTGWTMLMRLAVNDKLVERFDCNRLPRLINRPEIKKMDGGEHARYYGDPWYVSYAKSWDVCYGPDFVEPPERFLASFEEDVTDYLFDIDDLVAVDAPIKITVTNIANEIGGLQKLTAATGRRFPLVVKEISLQIFENPEDRAPASKRIPPPTKEQSAAATARLSPLPPFSVERERAVLNAMKFAEDNFRNCERIDKRGNVIPGHVWLSYDSNAKNSDSFIPQLDLAKEAGVGLIKVHAYWADIHGKSPFLLRDAETEKDFLHLIDLCHERGMKFIVYASPAWVKLNKAYDKRWEFSDPSMKMLKPQKWGLACTGSPEFRSFFFNGIDTLFKTYPVDGIYIDHGIYDEKERACQAEGHIHPFAKSDNYASSDDLLTKLYALCKAHGKLLYLFAESKPGTENYCDVQYVGESTPSMQAHLDRHRSFKSNLFFLPMAHFTYYSWREVYACTMPLGHFPLLSYPWKRVEGDDCLWFRHFLPLWTALSQPGTRIYRDIKESPVITSRFDKAIVTAFVNDAVYLVVANLNYKPQNIAFSKEMLNLENGSKAQTFTVPERDLLILRME